MLKFDKPDRIPVDSVQFWFERRRYAGVGLLSWDPRTGFELDAHLSIRSGSPPSGGVMMGKPYVVDLSEIAMKPDGADAAFATAAPHIDFFDHFSPSFWRTLTFDRARFVKRLSQPFRWCEARYRLEAKSLFPHQVTRTVTLGDTPPTTGWSMSGLMITDPRFDLRAIVEDGIVTVTWTLKDSTSVPLCRRWAWAIADAFSAVITSPCQLLSYEVVVGIRLETMLVQQRSLSPLITVPLVKNHPIDETTFAALVVLLASRSKEARVARQLVHRVIAAFQARSPYAKELIIGTALEAALRTLLDDRSKSFSVDGGLRKWRKHKALPKEWNRTHNIVYEAFRDIRHRNAHPHWLDEPGSTEAFAAASDALENQNVLVRYFGHMIRVLAGLDVDPDLGL